MGDGDPATRSRVSEVVRIVASAVVLVASLVLRVLGIVGPGDDPSPATVPDRDPGVQVRTVSPGTCVTEVYPRGYVHPVPCTEPHPTEIVALPRYPGPPGNAFPPIPDLYRQSFALCQDAFKAYTGTTPDQTPAGYGAVLPLGYEWDQGERIIVCYADGRNGVMLTQSLRKP